MDKDHLFLFEKSCFIEKRLSPCLTLINLYANWYSQNVFIDNLEEYLCIQSIIDILKYGSFWSANFEHKHVFGFYTDLFVTFFVIN